MNNENNEEQKKSPEDLVKDAGYQVGYQTYYEEGFQKPKYELEGPASDHPERVLNVLRAAIQLTGELELNDQELQVFKNAHCFGYPPKIIQEMLGMDKGQLSRLTARSKAKVLKKMKEELDEAQSRDTT